MKYLRHILFAFLYTFPWLLSFIFISFITNEGLRINFQIAYGNLFSLIYAILCILVFSSFFIFRFSIFKKKCSSFSYILSVALSILWIITTISFDVYTTHHIKFSHELWDEHPQTRTVLYENLIKETDLSGYTENQIVDLFGKPNSISDSTYIYHDSLGNSIYIKFSDGVVFDDYLVS